MARTLARTIVLVAGIGLASTAPTTVAAAGQAVSSADAKAWVGDWMLTIQGGRGPQERTLTIKDMNGKVTATLGGGRGAPIEISDVMKKGNDLMLKFKQQGRGGEADVTMTLMMQTDGTLKVSQELNGNTQSGTGKKRP